MFPTSLSVTHSQRGRPKLESLAPAVALQVGQPPTLACDTWQVSSNLPKNPAGETAGKVAGRCSRAFFGKLCCVLSDASRAMRSSTNSGMVVHVGAC